MMFTFLFGVVGGLILGILSVGMGDALAAFHIVPHMTPEQKPALLTMVWIGWGAIVLSFAIYWGAE